MSQELAYALETAGLIALFMWHLWFLDIILIQICQPRGNNIFEKRKLSPSDRMLRTAICLTAGIIAGLIVYWRHAIFA
jgi:hypothetical protein